MYDLAIIGAGPAGLSAAITARARNLSVVVVSNDPMQSGLAKAHRIDNYLGQPQISGSDLLDKMIEHAKSMAVEFLFERVITVLPFDGQVMLTTSGDNIEAKAVILAVGTYVAKPYAGELEYLGRGVSYCATCDGMFYRQSKVCVIGSSPEAVKEANFLNDIGAEVSYVSRKADDSTLALSPDITHKIAMPLEIKGNGMRVEGLVYEDTQSGERAEIECRGVFVLRPTMAPSSLVSGLDLADGKIEVDRKMQTNIKNIFAAGDCTGAPLQISKAVGEGQLACFAALSCLEQATHK